MRFFLITGVATPALLGQRVTIDEFSVRPLEFVQIGNGSALPMDISGFVVESRDAGLALLVQTIPPATILLPGESWVIGEAGVPNVDQVLSGPMFDDATGAITRRDPGNQIVDTVGYGHPPAALLPFTDGESLFGAQSPALPNTWQRPLDFASLGAADRQDLAGRRARHQHLHLRLRAAARRSRPVPARRGR